MNSDLPQPLPTGPSCHSFPELSSTTATLEDMRLITRP